MTSNERYSLQIPSKLSRRRHEDKSRQHQPRELPNLCDCNTTPSPRLFGHLRSAKSRHQNQRVQTVTGNLRMNMAGQATRASPWAGQKDALPPSKIHCGWTGTKECEQAPAPRDNQETDCKPFWCPDLSAQSSTCPSCGSISRKSFKHNVTGGAVFKFCPPAVCFPSAKTRFANF
jgi:hypothetical protein